MAAAAPGPALRSATGRTLVLVTQHDDGEVSEEGERSPASPHRRRRGTPLLRRRTLGLPTSSNEGAEGLEGDAEEKEGERAHREDEHEEEEEEAEEAEEEEEDDDDKYLLKSPVSSLSRVRRSAPSSSVQRPEATVPQEVFKRTLIVMQMLRSAQCAVVLTGPEISYPDVDDPAGPNGLWSVRKSGRRPELGKRMVDVEPLMTHMAVKAMVDAGLIAHVLTVCVDGLHARSGLSPDCLTELCGSVYTEVCETCEMEYVRAYDTTLDTDERTLYTGRVCEDGQCMGKLHHSLVHGGQNRRLAKRAREEAESALAKADLAVVLGYSARHRNEDADALVESVFQRGGDVVVCSLDHSPMEGHALVRVVSEVETVLADLVGHLEMEVHPFAALGGGETASQLFADVPEGQAQLSALRYRNARSSKCCIL